MAVRNFTTRIDVNKTMSEIEQILIKFGAKGIYKEYAGNKVSSLLFFIEKDNQKIPFKIPFTLEKSRTIIIKAVNEKKLPQKYLKEPLRSEQGERVGWRLIKDWIDCQLSLYEMNFADTIELLLPYAYNQVSNKTMYQIFLENKNNYLAIEQDVEDRINENS